MPVIQRANRALASEIGWARKIRSGSDQAVELESQQQEHQRRRHDQDRQQAGERLLLRPVAPRQLPAVARRELRAPRASACSSRLTEPRSRLSSSAVTVMTGCWFSRHSSLGLRTIRIVASWPSGTKPIPGGRGRARRWRGRSGRGHREADRQQAQVFAVVPDPVGIADADLGHPVLLGDRAGHLAVEGGVELGLDVQLGQADARRLDAVGPDHDVGIAEVDVRVDVGDACDLLDDLADLARPGRGGSPRSGPKTLTSIGLSTPARSLIWSCTSGTNSVSSSGTSCLQLLAERVEDLVHRPALPRGLEADEDVAGVSSRWRRSRARRRSGGCSRDVGRSQQHLLDPAQDLVGLGQRGADRHVVVEDERPFVHVGHEAGLQVRGTSHQPGTTASSASEHA